jgi:hypothetical protein
MVHANGKSFERSLLHRLPIGAKFEVMAISTRIAFGRTETSIGRSSSGSPSISMSEGATQKTEA